MAKTKIEWADRVWNPVTGCTKVSEGCRNCYAERMAKRLAGRNGYPPAPSQFNLTLHPDRLSDPLHWKEPSRVFVDSMSDLFHEQVPVDFIANIFNVMRLCDEHIFLILTKRPERMLKVLTSNEFFLEYKGTDGTLKPTLPLKNVWLGVSVENQKTAEERIPALLDTPAALHFVSCEPLLGEVRLDNLQYKTDWRWDVLSGYQVKNGWADYQADCSRLNWVICGGESGPGARPLHPDLVKSLRDQCVKANVPFYFKQWGEWSPEYPRHLSMANRKMTFFNGQTFYKIGKKASGRLLDGQIWDQYPEVQK